MSLKETSNSIQTLSRREHERDALSADRPNSDSESWCGTWRRCEIEYQTAINAVRRGSSAEDRCAHIETLCHPH